MKTLVLAAAILFPSVLPAAEPGTMPNQIRFDLLVVSVPEAKALELRAELQDPARIAGAQEKLIKLVTQKQAELVGWPTLTTKTGQRAVTEAVYESRYPVDFASATAHARGHMSPTADEAEPADAKHVPKAEAAVTAYLPVPIAYEKRDVGLTFEVEPTLGSDGTTVEMQIAPRHVQFLGYHKVPFEVKEEKIISTVEQPYFSTTLISTNITVKNGSRVMLGFEKVQKPEGNIEITILQTTVEPVRDAVSSKRKR